MKTFPSQLKAGTVGHVHSQIFRTLFFELETENDYVQPTDEPSINIVDDKNETFDIFKELIDLRKKYEHIIELLQRNIVNILFLSETKLDDSFPDSLFNVDNFSLHRSDRYQHGGGMLAYMRSDLAGDRNKQVEFKDIESLALEVTSDKQKWLFLGVYKPPSVRDNIFSGDFNKTTDKIVKMYENFIIMGDMNFNMLDDVKNVTLRDSCDIFCFKNLVKKPTCFSKNFKPTLIDLILTNQDKKCGKICNFGCGLSDCHNVIAIEVKCERPNSIPKYSKCRTLKI